MNTQQLGDATSSGEVAFQVLPVVSTRQVSILVGRATFDPGAALPCHRHPCDETVTVLQGAAVCYVGGHVYKLAAYETLHVPAGTPHRSANASNTEPMVMLCSYNSASVDRTILDSRECSESAPAE